MPTAGENGEIMENEDLDFTSLSEDAWRKQEAEDDLEIARINAGNQSFDQNDNHLNTLIGTVFSGGTINQQGKADDAIDFEDMDLSDDELPDEEEAPNGRLTPDAHGNSNERRSSGDLPGLTDDGGTSNDTDDLFGGDPNDHISSPLLHGAHVSSPRLHDSDVEDQIHLPSRCGETLEDLRLLNFDADDGPTADNQDPNIPEAPEDLIEIVKQAYPNFVENKILAWNDVIPVKEQHWISKKPPKPPKALVPTKLSLELEADQEKFFRLPGAAASTVWQKIKDAEARGLMCLEEPEAVEQADLEAFNLDSESDAETIGGFTLRDITVVCDDFDSAIDVESDGPTPGGVKPDGKRVPAMEGPDEDDLWMRCSSMNLLQSAGRSSHREGSPRFTATLPPILDNFTQATAKLGKRVILDVNDPYLLVDDVDSERATKRRKVQHKLVRMANGRMGQELTQRFNSSNDVAYDALKENHSNKIRATLAPIPVDHSMPALRLAWPYYTVNACR